MERQVVEPFEKATPDSKPHKKEAVAFLKAASRYWVETSSIGYIHPSLIRYSSAETNAMIAQGESLLKSGYDDHAIQFFLGHLIYNSSFGEDWSKAYLLCYQGCQNVFKDPIYSWQVKFIFLMEFRNLALNIGITGGNNSPFLTSWDNDCLTALKETLNGKEFTKNDNDFILFRQITDEAPDGNFSFLFRNCETLTGIIKNSKFFDWEKDCLMGYIEYSKARILDNAKSDGVSHEKKVQALYATANPYFEKAWKINKQQPESAYMQMDLLDRFTENHGKGYLRTLFDRSISAQCDYNSAYSEYLMDLENNEQRLSFAKANSLVNRYDTSIPQQVGHTLGYIINEIDSKKFTWKSYMKHPEIVNELISVDKKMAEDQNYAKWRPYYLSVFAINAWYFERYKLASEALTQLNGKLDGSAYARLARYRTNSMTVEAEIEIMNGAAKSDYLNALKERSEFHNQKAIRDFSKALSLVNREMTKQFIQGYIDGLQIENSFHSDLNWINLEKYPDAWNPIAGNWKVNQDGTIENRGTTSPQRLILRSRIGNNFELSGTVNMDNVGSQKFDMWSQFGILMGYISSSDDCHFLTCRINFTAPFPRKAGVNNKLEGSIFRGKSSFQYFSFYTDPSAHKPVHLKDSGDNTFLIRCVNGRLSCYLNNDPIVVNWESQKVIIDPKLSQIGFGSDSFSSADLVVIKNLQLRRIVPESIKNQNANAPELDKNKPKGP